MPNWEITGKWIKRGAMTTKTQVIAASNLEKAWERAMGLFPDAAELRCEATKAGVSRNVKVRSTGNEEPDSEPVKQDDANGTKPNVFLQKAKKNPFLEKAKKQSS
jgi:hypothetical protein